MNNNRILVVHDKPDLTQVSTLALEYHGFKVDSFNDQLFLQFYNTLKSENVLWNQGMSFFVDWKYY